MQTTTSVKASSWQVISPPRSRYGRCVFILVHTHTTRCVRTPTRLGAVFLLSGRFTLNRLTLIESSCVPCALSTLEAGQMITGEWHCLPARRTRERLAMRESHVFVLRSWPFPLGAQMNRDTELCGIAYIAFASLMFVAMASTIKVATRTHSPLEVVLLRSLISIPLLFFILPRHTRFNFRSHLTKENFLRSAFGYGGFAAFVGCAAKLPLSVVSAIFYTSPICSMLLSALLLKERNGAAAPIAATFGFLGTLAIVQPSISSVDGWIVLGLIGAVLDSLAVMMIRRIANTDTPERMALSFMLWSSAIGLPLAIPAWVWPAPCEWPLFLLIAVLAVLAQLAMGRGYARVRLSRAAPFDFVRLPACLVLDLMCFGTPPTPVMWLGSGLILFGTSVALADRTMRK